jgi:type VI secretion system protein ImpH
MATEIGENFTRLIEELKINAPSYNVFYAVYLAEKISKRLNRSEQESVGFDQRGMRFRPYEHYVFPSRDIRFFDYQDGLMIFVLNFLGLYGIDSPLPRAFHEQVALQQSIHGPGNVPLQNFLDIFNNRFYWLYYQSWKKYRYFLQLSDDPNNKMVQRIFTFIGQPGPSRPQEGLLSRYKLLQLSGVLTQRVRNKLGLEILLREFFPHHKINIKEFIPKRVTLDQPPQLGRRNGEDSFRLDGQSRLGRTQVDCMGRIRIEIGPIGFDEYLSFVPGNRKALLLQLLLGLYLNDGLEYDIKFLIRSETVGLISWQDKRLQLGISLWLGRPPQECVEVDFTYERLKSDVF